MKLHLWNPIVALLLPFGLYGQPSASYRTYVGSQRKAYQGGSISGQPRLQDMALANRLSAQQRLNLPEPEQALTLVTGNVPEQVQLSAPDELALTQGKAVTTLIIIDRAVPDTQLFSANLIPDAEIRFIESDLDGLAQLRAILADYHDLDAVHLFSHAGAGQLQLGNTNVDQQQLEQDGAFFSELNQAVKPGGDLLLYGCDLAKGQQGEALLNLIHGNSHVDVAASNNKTGNARLGGDWALEIQRGQIDSQVFSASALQDFSAILAVEQYVASDFCTAGASCGTSGSTSLTSTDGHIVFTGSENVYAYDSSFADGSLYLDYSSSATNGYLEFAADGTNVQSFQLTEINFSTYGGYNCSSADVTGYLYGGGTVSDSFTLSGSGTVPLSNLIGAQITHFIVNASGCNAKVYYPLRLDDFSVDNKLTYDSTAPTISSVSIPNSTMKIGDTVTATITVSSDSDDYTSGSGGISGTIGGFTLSSLSKTNDTTYTAQFTVTSGGTDVAAGSDIPVSFTLTDSSGNTSSTYSTAISQASDAIDANAPTVTSVSIPNTAMKVGDAVTVTITAGETGLSLNTGTVNGVSVAGFTDNADNTYSATYTVAEGNTDRAAGDSIPVSFVLNDAAGNSSSTYTTAISQNADAIDANSPVISSVSIPNTAMKIGDAVTVTITAGETGLSLNTGTVNGVSVTGFTDNADNSYSATYTVVAGNTDRAAGDSIPVSFILDDAAGNSSSTYTTAISQNADSIDATRPTISEVTAVSTPGNDSTPNYTFTTNETGSFDVGGSCGSSSSTTISSSGNQTITLTQSDDSTALADGTYSDCTVTVSDSAGNDSSVLSITSFEIDTTAPTLSVVTAVTSPTNDSTPDYSFTTNEAGTLAVGGSCGSTSEGAISSGSNSISLTQTDNSSSLADGTYSDCTVIVTDSVGNVSSALAINSFVVDATAPSLSEVTAVTTPANDTTPSYTFSTNETGSFSIGGSCGTSSSTTISSTGNQTITLTQTDGSSALADGTYSDCTVTATDSTGNASSVLTITSFTVDTTGPTLSEVTAVSTPTNDSTPSYTFTTNETGTFQVGGSCGTSSSTTISSAGNQTIILTQSDNSTALADGTYSDCTVTVTDSSNNASSALSITSFEIDTTAPSGQSVSFDDSTVNSSEASSVSFTFAGAEVGAGASYTISSSGGGTIVTGSQTLSSASEQISGLDLSGLGDGTLTLSVVLTDTAGNSATAVTDTATLDTTAPSGMSVSFDDSTVNSSEASSVSFTFAGAEVGASASYTISSSGGGTNVTGSQTMSTATDQISGLDLSGLGDGTLTLSVTLTDTAGNTSSAVTDTITLDTTGPTVSEVTAVSTPSNDSTPSYTFTTNEAGTLEVGGSCGSASEGAISSGSNTITLTQTDNSTAMADGTYSDCTVTVTDSAGNDSSALSITSFEIDTTAPSGQSVSFDDSTVNSSEASSVSFTFAGAEVGAGASYTISSSGGGTIVTGSQTLSSASEQISGLDVSGLGDGTLTLSVVLTDTAGNSATAVTDTATLDTTAPSGMSVSFDDTSLDSTNYGAASFTFASAEVGASASYTISSSGGGTDVTGTESISTAAQQITGLDLTGLSDGTLTLSVTLTDTAGNTSSAVTDTASLDASSPSVSSVVIGSGNFAAGDSISVNVTLTEDVTVSGSNSTLDLYIGSATEQATYVGESSGVLTYSYTVQSGDNDTDGVTALSSGISLNGDTIQDTGGNDADLTYTSETNSSALVDTSAPASPSITAPSEQVWVNADSYDISGTHSEDDITITLYADDDNDGSADNSTSLGTDVVSGGSWAITRNLTADSDHNYVVIASDTAGNTSSAVDVPTITEDSTAPDEPVITDPTADYTTHASSISISGTHGEDGITINAYADDDSDGVADNATVLASAEVGSSTSGEWSISLSLTADSENDFVLQAEDLAGNTSGEVATVTIAEDSTAPVVSIDSLTTNDASPALSGSIDDDDATLVVTVDGVDYSATNNADGTWSIADDSITALANGTYDLVLTATDAYGNIGTDDSADELEIDLVPPTGYSVSFSSSSINASNESSVSFVLSDGETGALYSFTIVSSGGGSISGSGTVSSTSQTVSGLDLSALGEGTVTLTLSLADSVGNVGNSVTATASKAYNSAPVITQGSSVSVSMDEDSSPTAFSLTLNATDADNDSLSWSVTTSASNGSAAVASSGLSVAVSYSPTAEYSGSDSFIVQVSDGSETDSITVNVAIGAVDDIPEVDDLSLSVDEDSSLSISLTATDIDSSSLTFSVQTQPEHGSLSTVGSDWTYLPDADYNGSDSFSYVANDGTSNSAVATVSITVVPVNDVPAANDDAFSLSFSSDNIYSLTVLENDEDIDGDSLSISSAKASPGSVSIDGQTLVYQAPSGFSGDVSLQYRIKDGNGGTDSAGVSLVIAANTDAPEVIAPADKEVNATGLLTRVALGSAIATDSAGNALAVSRVTQSTLFKPGLHQVYWQATDDAGNTGNDTQQLKVNPLITLGKDKVVAEGGSTAVKVFLNGLAPVYPFEVFYSVSGDAEDGVDYDSLDGSVVFVSGTQTLININALTDSDTEADETLVISLSADQNLGNRTQASVVISEANIAPEVSLTVSQNDNQRSKVSQDEGLVTVTATASDANASDSLSYVWLATPSIDNLASDEDTFSFDPSLLATGVYTLAVTVTDDGTPQMSDSASSNILVKATLASLGDTDTDGDLIPDDEEGYADADGDGIDDYQDAVDECHLLPEQLAQQSRYLVEGEPVGCLVVGAIAKSQERASQLDLSLGSISDDDDVINTGGLFDFMIYDLPQGLSDYRIVLPQAAAIPAQAVYRKYIAGSGWQDFVEDDNNQVFSAAGEPGVCPPPGSSGWDEGLIEGYWCVQLLLEDGGPNDDDGEVNGMIPDPGGVGVLNTGNSFPVANDDSAATRRNASVTIDVLGNDTDADGDELTIDVATAELGQVSIIDNQLLFTPETAFVGTDSLTYTITDGQGGSASAAVSITVTVNRAPVTQADTGEVQAGDSLTLTPLVNDTDSDGDSLQLTSATAAYGSVTVNDDNSLTYSAPEDFLGTDSVSYQVTDGYDSSDGTIIITVVEKVETITVTNSSGGGSFGWWLLGITTLGLALRYRLKRREQGMTRRAA